MIECFCLGLCRNLSRLDYNRHNIGLDEATLSSST